MEKIYTLFGVLCLALSAQAQTQLTSDQLRELYTSTDGKYS